ncbi:phosphoglycerate dehydrogenase-like oxidoreductase [Lachnospiraceae bacterium JC7]|nr:phosphoglycerate dehydrogenase-like oxidoreductase [Lachnospiraceae bacterium JC7]
MGWKVLLPQELKKDARDLLESHGMTLIDGRGFETEDVIADMKEHQPDAIIVRITKMTREVFEAAAPNLKVLARHGAGYDAVDLQAAKDYGVKCLYAPVANSTSVAETAIMHMLYLSRNVTRLQKMLKVDFYDAKLKTHMTTLNGKTVGIIGCGNIGSRVAKRCLAMEMNVLCYDPYKPASEFPDGVEVTRDLERIFKESDFVSLHAPNTSVTKNMVNKETLALMKPTAFLINTARGALVNEEDLYEACKNHQIAGAGLDAIAHEPILPDMPLSTLDNVLITPHVGGNSIEAALRASYHSAMGVLEMYEGKTPTWPIPDIDYETAKTYDDVKVPERKSVGMYDF